MRWKLSDYRQWHSWFAWYPVAVYGDRVWLETVECRIESCNEAGIWWEYRMPGQALAGEEGYSMRDAEREHCAEIAERMAEEGRDGFQVAKVIRAGKRRTSTVSPPQSGGGK